MQGRRDGDGGSYRAGGYRGLRIMRLVEAGNCLSTSEGVFGIWGV